ncbi:MAG: hypothetical protein ACREI2_06900, partial [Nitrospiraceae bacterium]
MDRRDMDEDRQDRLKGVPPIEVINGRYASGHPRRFPILTVVEEPVEPRLFDWALPISLFLVTVFT